VEDYGESLGDKIDFTLKKKKKIKKHKREREREGRL
jgi:hypothetical protein